MDGPSPGNVNAGDLELAHENTVQTWFHANPEIQATELLLHERPMREAVLRAEHKQFAQAERKSA